MILKWGFLPASNDQYGNVYTATIVPFRAEVFKDPFTNLYFVRIVNMNINRVAYDSRHDIYYTPTVAPNPARDHAAHKLRSMKVAA